ncbi:MAG: MarR family transcriptional regulator [Verrucomicrobia bacterium]|nr:MarR family transcriptional regulator [Verrucomicrobiota bacterium]
MKANFTPGQAQFLAFIYHSTKLNRRPPAEADVQRYFLVTPPSVHQMILRLERQGSISRVPGQARCISLRVEPTDLPPLE